ncbi:MAG: divergent PAP2 family protein [Sphaerochaetaceae bacterium]|nr:divergent PAP2 family protein [Sphaerochaetaceae bacterium]MDC7248164.1 divergent PAP2 family protein [Sphaerochaetaceae bacterium]
MDQILLNRPLAAAFFSAVFAQFLKPFIFYPIEKKFDIHLFYSTGGMPSSHTAAVVALCTSILVLEGWNSYYFAISLTFAAIVIHDSMGIRRAAGKQAAIINEWSRIFTEIHEQGQFTPENLKTMLGHSFTQVVGGFALGIFFGLLFTIIL